MSLIDSSPSSGSSFAKKLLKSLSRKDSIKRLEFKPAEPDSSKMDVIEVNNQKKKKKSLSKRLGKQLSGSFKKLVSSRSPSTTSSASFKNASWPTAESVSDSKSLQEDSVTCSIAKESPAHSVNKQADTIPAGFLVAEKSEEAPAMPVTISEEVPEAEDVQGVKRSAEHETDVAKESAIPDVVLPSANFAPLADLPPTSDVPVVPAFEAAASPTTTLAMAPAPRSGFFRSLLTTAVVTVAVAAVSLGTGALPRMGGASRKASSKGPSPKPKKEGEGKSKGRGFMGRMQGK